MKLYELDKSGVHTGKIFSDTSKNCKSILDYQARKGLNLWTSKPPTLPKNEKEQATVKGANKKESSDSKS